MPKGRRFAVWEFREGPQQITIECRTREQHRGVGIQFFVEDARFELYLDNVDPNVLKQQVAAHLKNYSVKTWEYFMVVEVSSLRNYREEDELEPDKDGRISPYLATDPRLAEERRYFTINQTIGMRLEIEAWRKATVNDKEYYEKYGHSGWSDAHGEYGAQPANVGTDEDDSTRSRSVLPITEENMAALRNIVVSFHQLRGLLAEVLSPRRIETTLAGAVNFLPRLPELPALPAPAAALPPKCENCDCAAEWELRTADGSSYFCPPHATKRQRRGRPSDAAGTWLPIEQPSVTRPKKRRKP